MRTFLIIPPSTWSKVPSANCEVKIGGGLIVEVGVLSRHYGVILTTRAY